MRKKRKGEQKPQGRNTNKKNINKNEEKRKRSGKKIKGIVKHMERNTKTGKNKTVRRGNENEWKNQTKRETQQKGGRKQNGWKSQEGRKKGSFSGGWANLFPLSCSYPLDCDLRNLAHRDQSADDVSAILM